MSKKKYSHKNSIAQANNLTPLGYMNQSEYLIQGFPANTIDGSGIRSGKGGVNPANTAPSQNINYTQFNAKKMTSFNQWVSLLQIDTSIWIVNRMNRVPVEDGFRKVNFSAENGLDEDQIKYVSRYIKVNGIFKELKETIILSRIFGGAALLFLSKEGKNEMPIEKGEDIVCKAVDLWQLNRADETLGKKYEKSSNTLTESELMEFSFIDNDTIFKYKYGMIHPSRCVVVKNRPAPNYFASITRGWGLPELDSCLQGVNSWNRFINEIFDLMKEVVIDQIGIEDLNTVLLNDQAYAQFISKMNRFNRMKSSFGTMVTDIRDKFDRKQIDIGSIMTGGRELMMDNVCGATGIPREKLFGDSAKGLNNGGDISLENYNVKLENLRETWIQPTLKTIANCCQIILGYIPENLDCTFETIRVLNPDQEIAHGREKYNILLDLKANNLISGKQLIDQINNLGLFKVNLEFEDIKTEPIKDDELTNEEET